MSDLSTLLGSVDRLPAPDLWPRIETATPQPPREPRRSRRVLAAALALVLGAVGVAVAVQALRPRAHAPGSVEGKANGEIAFVVVHLGASAVGGTTSTDIDAMSPDGSDVHRLLRLSGAVSGLSWSPDGTRLLFDRLGGQFGPLDLKVVNADGTGLHTVLHCPGTDCFGGASWSPDGTRIAFVRGVNIAVSGADGSGAHDITHCHPAPLTHDASSCYLIEGAPSWSPDGTKIAFAQQTVSGEGGIFVVDADGTDLNRITSCDTRLCRGGSRDADPGWSPDGHKILFTRARNVYVVGAGGGEATPLTHCAEVYLAARATCEASQPVWAPDGTAIAFQYSDRGTGAHSIALMSATGSSVYRIGPSGGADPVWQPVPVGGASQASECRSPDRPGLLTCAQALFRAHVYSLTPPRIQATLARTWVDTPEGSYRLVWEIRFTDVVRPPQASGSPCTGGTVTEYLNPRTGSVYEVTTVLNPWACPPTPG